MVKRFLKDTMRFETPRECLEFQLNGTRACMYEFDKYGVCGTYILGDANAITVPSNEMLKIALEHFEKYGEVEFDAFLDNDRSDIVTIGCWDENATYSKTVVNRQIAMLEEERESYKKMTENGELTKEDEEIWLEILKEKEKMIYG
jgi:hypothetical protein